jgi:hypothetical protein
VPVLGISRINKMEDTIRGASQEAVPLLGRGGRDPGRKL